MRIKSVSNTRGQKIGAIVCLVSVLLLTVILNIGAPKTYAGNFSPRKVTISDSRASGSSVVYDFAFTVVQTTAIKQIDFKFCTQAGAFTDTCTAPTGFSATSGVRGSDNITGTGRTDSSPAANSFRSVITTPATQSPTAVTYSLNTITNPSTTNTSFYVRIITYSDTGTTEIDSGTVAFATLTLTSMAVSATVLENFTFAVAGVASGTVNGATINVATAANTIPFGTLAVGTPNIGAHDVTVTTNAASGYAVTTKGTTTPLLVSGSQNIDEFSGSYGTPTTWSAPAGTAASVNTGYFGYTTEDTDYSQFQSNKWAGGETTARSIITSTVGVSAQTVRIGWQAQVNAIQPAGTYSGTEILVATPTY
jgi:hypothetical protein